MMKLFKLLSLLNRVAQDLENHP